ncbi:hypothetical protein [Eggerthella sp. YY7918]|uniref:InlB B-repeat-containing protein n=1 Tax=Eggerthella sp. (strain YY7918) TaxID=502558 RepID=UPI00021712B6|nr:hypothetical protein [Eggerthella sp. YY7918]BAK44187.1 glutamyl-tRNA synthetase [Eggerthella sp. YY7918]
MYAGIIVGRAHSGAVLEGVNANGEGMSAETVTQDGKTVIGAIAGEASSVKKVHVELPRPAMGISFGDPHIGGAVGEATGPIENVHVKLASLSGEAVHSGVSVGGVVGFSSYAIRNCTVQVAGDMSAQSESSVMVGGVVGLMSGFSGTNNIEGCSVTVGGSILASSSGGSASVGNAFAGGILGWAQGTSMVKDCVAKVSGDVRALSQDVQSFSGGIAGYLQYGIEESGCSVAGSVEARSATQAHAGGMAGLCGTTLKKSASWVSGSVSAEGEEKAMGGGLAGSALRCSIDQAASTVTGSVGAVSSGVSYAGGLVGRVVSGGLFRNVVTHITDDVSASGAGSRYSGGLAGLLPFRLGTSEQAISEVKGSVEASPGAGGCAGGLMGYLENQGSGHVFMNSVALVNAVSGEKAFRVGDAADIDPGSGVEPFSDNYALSTTMVNGATVPPSDPEIGGNRRHGADWPDPSKTWEDIFYSDTAWTYPPGSIPRLVAEDAIAAKLGRVPAGVYLATIDPAIAHGTVTISPAGLVDEGATVTVTVKPETGYRLVKGSLAYRGASVGDPVSIADGSFTMPAESVVVTASFEMASPSPAPTSNSSGGTLATTGDPMASATAAMLVLAIVAAGACVGARVRKSCMK